MRKNAAARQKRSWRRCCTVMSWIVWNSWALRASGMLCLPHMPAQLDERRMVVEQKIAALQAQLAAFFGRFALEDEPNETAREERLRERCRQLQEALRQRGQAQERIARLLAEHPELAEAGDEAPADAEALRAQWDAVRKEIETHSERITAGKSRVERLTEEGDQVTEYESEKLRLQESLAEGQHRHALLVKTARLMEQAKENLSTRYLRPVMTRFAAYAGAFVPELGETAIIDTSLDVKVERQGERRGGTISARVISASWISVCVLPWSTPCIRGMPPA